MQQELVDVAQHMALIHATAAKRTELRLTETLP